MVREGDVDKRPSPWTSGGRGPAPGPRRRAPGKTQHAPRSPRTSLRDSGMPRQASSWIVWSPITYRKEIGARRGHLSTGPAGRPLRPRQIVLFKNRQSPADLIGPWSHVQDHGLDLAPSRRFYDYWLKGIDNGIMKEDPITILDGERLALRPPVALPEEKRTSYWSGADAGSRGKPFPKRPTTARRDYSASGLAGAAWSLEEVYPADLSATTPRALTYTTPPCDRGRGGDGNPVVRLCSTADAADAALFVSWRGGRSGRLALRDGRLPPRLARPRRSGFDYRGCLAPQLRGRRRSFPRATRGLASISSPRPNLFDAGPASA